jgi:catechol 2,3-dioxygenase-like lactoylglutathione lyase family enzyme
MRPSTHQTGRPLMKTICFLLFLMSPVVVRGQSAAQTPNGPVSTATGAFFALSVADVKASARWYAEKLGLKIVMEEPERDKTAVVVLEGGGLIVELIERDDRLPLRKATEGIADNLRVHGIVKAGFIVDDFEKAIATLKKRHVEIAFGPFPARTNQRANVIVRDNAGNLIQVFGGFSGAERQREPLHDDR